MKTKYFKFLSVFVAVIIAFSCFSFSVSAAPDYTFDFPIAQPQVSDNMAYIEVLYQREGFSSPSCEVVFINLLAGFSEYPTQTDPDYSILVNVSSSQIELSGTYYYEDDIPSLCAFYYSTFNNSGFLDADSNGDIFIDYGTVLGVHFYGDVEIGSTITFSGKNNFVCNYSSDALAVEKLNGIYDTLKSFTAGDPCFDIPEVGGSSLDYGFLNYSVPVLENLNGSVIGGSSVYGPYLEPKDNYKAPFPYYSYSCASSLKLNSGKFSSSTSYVVSLSLNFNAPVYRASFKIYLRDATFVNQVFTSYGSDELSPGFVLLLMVTFIFLFIMFLILLSCILQLRLIPL